MFKRSQHHASNTWAQVLVCDRWALGTARCLHAIVFVFKTKHGGLTQIITFPKHSLNEQSKKWKFILL